MRLPQIALLALVSAACAATPAGMEGADSGPGVDSSPPAPRVDAGPAASCVPPDMLIVLDRSLSMKEKTPDNRIRWFVAEEVVGDITAEYEDTIRFGLELFPLDPGTGCFTIGEVLGGADPYNQEIARCETEPPVVDPGVQNAAAVQAAIASAKLCRKTPLEGALDKARLALPPDPQQPDRQRFVMLITDGEERCDGDPPDGARRLRSDGIQTYAIGFGNRDGRADLNGIAQEGGTARPPDANGDRYYHADDGTALRQAMEEIAIEICCNCIE